MITENRVIRLMIVAGIRPQFIKAAILRDAIADWNTTSPIQVEAMYVNTGQHYDFELAGKHIQEQNLIFDATFDHSNVSPLEIFGQTIIQMDALLDRIRNLPDWVIVFGDANCTLATAIASNMRGLRIVHVEAGMRPAQDDSPEHLNCKLVDFLSDVHFVATKDCLKNLRGEGIAARVYWTGDLYYDHVRRLSYQLSNNFKGYSSSEYILITLHHISIRESETDGSITNTIEAMRNYSRKVLFVCHPRIRRQLDRLFPVMPENIDVTSSLSHSEMLTAIKNSAFVLTDSGGVQREAYFLKKRCLILQSEPWWPTLIEQGVHFRIGRSVPEIEVGLKWVEDAITSGIYPKVDDFGDGNAGATMIKILADMTAS